MRKKLDTRFPAARIKKIMQADEDVGKIAMAVPLLVSKALELFLQDLCNRTYDITLKRGAKTMNSLHLKQCVHAFNVFDFLREIVGKVPDLGSSDTGGGEDRSATKRRKVAEEGNFSDEETKKNQIHEASQTGGGSGKGRGRGRGRGRPRGGGGRTGNGQCQKFVDDPAEISPQRESKPTSQEFGNGDAREGSTDKVSAPNGYNTSEVVVVRNFDLNLDLDENGETTAPALLSQPRVKPNGEHPGLVWPLPEMEDMRIDPNLLARLNRKVEEDEEDYDEES